MRRSLKSENFRFHRHLSPQASQPTQPWFSHVSKSLQSAGASMWWCLKAAEGGEHGEESLTRWFKTNTARRSPPTHVRRGCTGRTTRPSTRARRRRSCCCRGRRPLALACGQSRNKEISSVRRTAAEYVITKGIGRFHSKIFLNKDTLCSMT